MYIFIIILEKWNHHNSKGKSFFLFWTNLTLLENQLLRNDNNNNNLTVFEETIYIIWSLKPIDDWERNLLSTNSIPSISL